MDDRVESSHHGKKAWLLVQCLILSWFSDPELADSQKDRVSRRTAQHTGKGIDELFSHLLD